MMAIAGRGNKPQRGGIKLGRGETLDRRAGSVAIRSSHSASKQSSQTASFKGMSSIRSRSSRPMGQPSHMAQACDLRPGNRMDVVHGRSEAPSHPHMRSVKFKLNCYLCSTENAPDRAKDASRHQATIDVSSYPAKTEVPFR